VKFWKPSGVDFKLLFPKKLKTKEHLKQTKKPLILVRVLDILQVANVSTETSAISNKGFIIN
jgi:hypothetical protein